MLLPLLLALGLDFGPTHVFERLPADSEEYLSAPAAFVFSPQGRLYTVDSNTSRVHVWRPDRSYLTSFGKKGEGPGEFLVPVLIDADKDHLWIIDSRGVASQLDHDGAFLTSFRVNKPRLRRFAVLAENRFLATTREQVAPTEIYNRIETLNAGGETVALLKKWRNESFTAPREGNNYAKVKAFPPACEIQRGPDGFWRIGFSQNNALYTVDAAGTAVAETLFELPGEKVTDEERVMYEDLAIPCFGGGNFVFKNYPNIRTDFDFEKARYTRFAVQKDRVIFLQTPDGGVFGCEGFPKGQWFVCDLESGKLLDRGFFDYPDGSMVYVRHDRIVGFLIGEDEDFVIKELNFSE